MLALVLGDTPRVVSDHPEPVCREGEARVQMHVAGVCDTDLQLALGYMGYRGVLGHEAVGRVIECGDSDWVGRRVVADINAGCGQCGDCLQRDGHHCATRTVLGIVARDGVFAEQFVVPTRNLVAVPDEVSDDCAVFSEPLAAALHVLDDIPVSAHVGVLGDGKLGLLIALALHGAGRKVTAIGHHAQKLAIAAGGGVATCLEDELRDDRFDAVVEATGSATGLAVALQRVQPRGTVVLKTTVAKPEPVDLAPVVIHELRIVGSRCGAMASAIEHLSRGRVDPTPLIAARYKLADAERAMAAASARGTLKILVDAH